MAIQKSIIWKQVPLEKAYLKILRECSKTFPEIVLGVFTCKESKDLEEGYIYTISVPVPEDIISSMFSEEVLKQPDISNMLQSYIYLKTLPEYSDTLDV
jgi:hypothetical protein